MAKDNEWQQKFEDADADNFLLRCEVDSLRSDRNAKESRRLAVDAAVRAGADAWKVVTVANRIDYFVQCGVDLSTEPTEKQPSEEDCCAVNIEAPFDGEAQIHALKQPAEPTIVIDLWNSEANSVEILSGGKRVKVDGRLVN